MIDWTLLRRKFGQQKAADKFEKLAFRYVEDVYPDFNWLPTPRQGDGNRDARVALDGEYEIWEEAKYRNGVQGPTHKRDRSLERKDIDSTILSGLIHGKVRLIIFVSNAEMPDTVMSRAMLGARIRGIEVTCALSSQLENWLRRHKSVYEAIFESQFPAESTSPVVWDFQTAIFYDLLSTDFAPLQQKKNFYIGELCMLELVVYTSETAVASFKPIDVPFRILEHPDFNRTYSIDLSAGMSSLVFLVQMERPHTGGINLCLEIDGKPFYRVSNQVVILRESRFRISYGQQLEIIHQVRQKFLQPMPFQQGMMVTLCAGSSMGKSFILRQLVQEFSLKYDISIIEFDSNEHSLVNYSLLCKIVLFLFYGNIFWDMVSNQPAEIKSFKLKILKANTKELFDNNVLSQFIDGCFDPSIASSVIQAIIRRIKRESIPIVGGRRSKLSRILLLDDFQYLYGPQETFMKLLLDQVSRYHNSNILVISATKGKFKSEAFETYFHSLTPNRFTLNGLTRTDKSETLRTVFQIPQSGLDAVADHILPSSPLLAGEILRSISSHLDGDSDPISVILAYTGQVDNLQLLQNKFIGFEKQFYLLDIIYKFKKGILLSLIKNYPAFAKIQIQKDVKLLLGQNLISIHNGIVTPYHEYYISAYQQMRGEKSYCYEVGLFLEYLLVESSRLKTIDVNQLLAMLLRCGSHHAKAYRKQVKKCMLEYIHETQFGAALQFCEYYYDQIAPIGNRELTHEESYFLYLYADCLVHCDHLGRAHEKLQEVYRYAKTDSLEKYEAGASLLNQLFWEICPAKVIADSFLVQQGIEQLPKALLRGENKRRMKRSYNNCFNRRMVAYLLTDEVVAAREVYLNQLKSYIENGHKTFRSESATIIMDYARGLSFFQPEESYRLIQVALKFFKSDAKQHYRRILLCEIDAEVLKMVVSNKYAPQTLLRLEEQLLKSGFLSEYFKAVMKRAACKLIACAALGNEGVQFSPDAQVFRDIEDDLQTSLLATQLRPKNRELLLMNYIKAFIAVRRGKIELAKELLNTCSSILAAAGRSYQEALVHNLAHLEEIKTIAWYTSQSKSYDNVFFIDCRFW